MALYEFIDLSGLQAFKEEFESQNNSAYATTMTITQNSTTGVLTFKLYASDGTLLDEKTLDLDTEHIIKSVSLDYEHKKLIFTMNDNSTIECNISDLIDGLNFNIQAVADNLLALETSLNNANIDLISNNDLDEIFPNLEEESEEQ